MTKKPLVIGLACCFMLCGIMLPSLQALDVPCKVVITAPEGEDPHPRFGKVEMSHAKHRNVSCVSCHHMFDGCGDFQKCADCHIDRDDRSYERGFYKAWHSESEISCRGCHKAMKAKNEQTGPIGCLQGCHEAAQK
ncbi:cytochrome c3 family protein [Megalodesulfovibrio gigas]|nr:cytochrome c3 family protein [Megalodesulfovibrio gigas]